MTHTADVVFPSGRVIHVKQMDSHTLRQATQEVAKARGSSRLSTLVCTKLVGVIRIIDNDCQATI